jgi:hypothetical protein
MRRNSSRIAVAMTVVGMMLVPIWGEAQVAGGASASHLHELVPLYDGGNAADWAQTCAQVNGSGDGSWIIADVVGGDGGAGTAPNAAWGSAIDNCYQYNKASVLGYVFTNFGQVPLATVEAGIDNWYKFYPGDVAGIFLDDAADTIPGTATSNTAYYQALATYIHTGHGNNNEVVFNFGRNPGSDWMFDASAKKDADLIVTFEGSYDTPGMNPYTDWVQPAWELQYPASDFAAIVHDAPSTTATPQPSTTCAGLTQQHVGYVDVGAGTTYAQIPYLEGIC